MSPAERAGILIGSAGVALSLYNTWRQRQADRPRLRVELRRSTTSDHLPSWLNPLVAEGEHWLEVRLSNVGGHVVTLNGIGFLTSRHQSLDMSNWERTLAGGEWANRFSELAPGKATSVYIEECFVVEALLHAGQRSPMRVRAGCWDQLGTLYRSKPITVEVEGGP